MNEVVHCPDCGAEYRSGYTICTDCGGLLESGPTHRVAPASVAYRADADDASGSASSPDLFEREETSTHALDPRRHGRRRRTGVDRGPRSGGDRHEAGPADG